MTLPRQAVRAQDAQTGQNSQSNIEPARQPDGSSSSCGSRVEIHRRVIGAAKSTNGNPFDIRNPVTGTPDPVLRFLFDAMIEK